MEGNDIEKLSELDKLANLPQLQSLSIQGNEKIESISGYKNYVIARLQQLKKFNSAPITKQDRMGAIIYSGQVKQKKKRGSSSSS